MVDQRSRSLIIYRRAYPSATHSRYATTWITLCGRVASVSRPRWFHRTRDKIRDETRSQRRSWNVLTSQMEDVFKWRMEKTRERERERERSLISAHRLASPSARENRPSDDPPRRTRTRIWDAQRSRTSSRVAPPVVRANRSSCPRDSPKTALSPRTRAPRQARETGGTRLPVNHVAQDPVVRGNPLRPGISRRPVIDGREPARWSRRYRPVSRTQKKKVTFQTTS